MANEYPIKLFKRYCLFKVFCQLETFGILSLRDIKIQFFVVVRNWFENVSFKALLRDIIKVS